MAEYVSSTESKVEYKYISSKTLYPKIIKCRASQTILPLVVRSHVNSIQLY